MRRMNNTLFSLFLGTVCISAVAAAQSPSPAKAPDLASPAFSILHPDAVPTAPGPANHFIGAVKMDTLSEPIEGLKPRVLSVTFAPCARTAWHSHPMGQLLIVTAGSGFVQQQGGPIQAIHVGDIIWTPPNVRHWHGAAPDASMTHIAIYEEPKGKVTQWFEQVTDEEYAKAK